MSEDSYPNMCVFHTLDGIREGLSHDFASENKFCTGASGYVLREYATHAVRDYIVDELNLMMGLDTQLRVYPILDMAKDLAKLDGALHIGADRHLQGFACLLDGRALAGENRARGARFNSALRFSALNPQVIVIVVSVDRPVSVIQQGVELNAQCLLRPVSWLMTTPPTLQEWLKQEGF